MKKSELNRLGMQDEFRDWIRGRNLEARNYNFKIGSRVELIDDSFSTGYGYSFRKGSKGTIVDIERSNSVPLYLYVKFDEPQRYKCPRKDDSYILFPKRFKVI